MSLKLVIQSEDGQAAEAFRRKWTEVRRLLTQNEKLRTILPNCEQLARLLEPKAQADRLTVTVDQEGTAALLEALEALASPVIPPPPAQR